MTNILAALLCLLMLTACQGDSVAQKDAKAKNVILVIGDGMGPQQLSLLYYFAKLNSLGVLNEKDFALKKVANAGKTSFSATEPFGNIVVDSACSASQIATGVPSRPEMVGLDKDGNVVETIAEKAIKAGLATGLISDTRMTHATMASFASHVPNRWLEDEISAQMINSGVDVLFSGGANRFVPQGANKQLADHITVKSKRKDGRNLLAEAQKNGYRVMHSKQELEANQAQKGQKILGLFTNHNMPNGIWYTNNKKRADRKIPTLKEMTEGALKILEKNEKGFFLMVEAGQIDWGGHQNDAGVMLHELLSLNETVNYLHEWVKKHPDTLLVITADHETGNFAFGYNVHGIPGEETLSGNAFKERKYSRVFNYGRSNTVDQIYRQKSSLKELWKRFDKFEPTDQTPERLKNLILTVTGYEISLTKAKEILSKKPNPYYLKWHKVLNQSMVPVSNDFQAFYYDPYTTKICLVGRAIGPQQSVTWGTGGHTATPVGVFSQGPEAALKEIQSYTTHSDLGKSLRRILGL